MNPIKEIPLHAGHTEIWSHGAENLSVHLTYDLRPFLASWPAAKPTVAFERADGQKYAHSWSLQDSIVHIPLLQADTEIPGMCKCMITLHSGDGQANTCVFCGHVTAGIDTLGETPSDPAQGVIEQVNAAALRAEIAAGMAPGGSTTANSGIFFVHISADDPEHATADKTFSDVQSAMNAGQMAYAILNSAYYIPLIGIAEDTAIFSMLASIFDAITSCSVIMMADGSIIVSTT